MAHPIWLVLNLDVPLSTLSWPRLIMEQVFVDATLNCYRTEDSVYSFPRPGKKITIRSQLAITVWHKVCKWDHVVFPYQN